MRFSGESTGSEHARAADGSFGGVGPQDVSKCGPRIVLVRLGLPFQNKECKRGPSRVASSARSGVLDWGERRW